jgi:hypothetical protein
METTFFRRGLENTVKVYLKEIGYENIEQIKLADRGIQ